MEANVREDAPVSQDAKASHNLDLRLSWWTPGEKEGSLFGQRVVELAAFAGLDFHPKNWLSLWKDRGNANSDTLKFV